MEERQVAETLRLEGETARLQNRQAAIGRRVVNVAASGSGSRIAIVVAGRRQDHDQKEVHDAFDRGLEPTVQRARPLWRGQAG